MKCAWKNYEARARDNALIPLRKCMACAPLARAIGCSIYSVMYSVKVKLHARAFDLMDFRVIIYQAVRLILLMRSLIQRRVFFSPIYFIAIALVYI